MINRRFGVDAGNSDTDGVNVKYRAGVSAYRLAGDNLEQVIAKYKAGASSYELAEEYGVHSKTVRRWLHKAGVTMRSVGHPREYTFDENFFDEVDTESKAYILGLFYADGSTYMKDNQYFFTIRLAAQDREVLEKIRTIWQGLPPLARVPPRKNSKQVQWNLQISSKKICKRFESLGLMPNKSLRLVFPDWMPDELTRHFIRGYMDGDGSIGENRGRVRLEITSTEAFCHSISRAFRKELRISSNIYAYRKIHRLQITGRPAMRALDWLYNDATIYMERKHDIYVNLRHKHKPRSIQLELFSE